MVAVENQQPETTEERVGVLEAEVRLLREQVQELVAALRCSAIAQAALVARAEESAVVSSRLLPD